MQINNVVKVGVRKRIYDAEYIEGIECKVVIYIWINFAVLTCTTRTPPAPVVEQWGDKYPLFR